MIRILHIVAELDGGGVEKLLLNYYENMNKNEFKFDFVVFGDKIGFLEQKFKHMGSSIFHITPKKENLIKSIFELDDVIKKGNYNVVHAHQNMSSLIAMILAKKDNVNVRIAHAHFAFRTDENKIKKIINLCLRPILKHYATHWFACGIEAGKSLWGERAYKKGKIIVLNNAISIEKFVFNQSIREEMKKRLSLTSSLVVGHVGRMSYQKNHDFLLVIFNQILKMVPDAILLCAGDGELREEIEIKIQDLGIGEHVLLLGNRNDVHLLMQAMDVFVLPSRFEGLPVVGIEAQAAGLPCVFASTITDEVGIHGMSSYLPLDNSEIWANTISQYKKFPRKDSSKILAERGYSILHESKKLETFYKEEL